METIQFYYGEFINSPYTQNTLDFVNIYFTEILLGFYILLSFYATYVIYKQSNLIRALKGKNLILGLVLETLSAVLIDKIKHGEKLEKELKETRENRDKRYNVHNTTISRYKKRFLALMISIKDNFKTNEAIVKLLKNDFYDLQKKKYKDLLKIEKNLDKKQK